MQVSSLQARRSSSCWPSSSSGGNPFPLVEADQRGPHRRFRSRRRNPVGGSRPIASRRRPLDMGRQRLADRRGGWWTSGAGEQSRLDPRPATRLQDGGGVNPNGRCIGWAATLRRFNRPIRDGASCWALLRRRAFAFFFACPSDDSLYFAVWCRVGCSIVTVLGRPISLLLSRW